MVEVPWHKKAATMIGKVTNPTPNETTCSSNLYGGFRVTFRHDFHGNHTAEILSFIPNRDMAQPSSQEFFTRGVIGLHGGVQFYDAEHIKVSDLGKLAKAVRRAHAALQKHAPK